MSVEILDTFREWMEGKTDADKSKAATVKLLPLLSKENIPWQRYPRPETIPRKKISLDYRRRRMGIRYWLRRTGSCDRFGRRCEHPGSRYRSLFKYRRTIIQINAGRSRRKFAASGKKVRKKDLGAMAMTYGYVMLPRLPWEPTTASCSAP